MRTEWHCKPLERASWLFLLACSAVFGQAVSQISGTAKDQSGAVVPGVEITATQTDTGIKRTAVTDQTGAYTLPNLPLGRYRLDAAKPGFRSYVQTGIVLEVGTSPDIPIPMGVGQVSESVQVEANASQVEMREVGVGNVIETQQILDLPLNGRDATNLITLGGAAVLTASASGDTVAMHTGPHIAIAGGQDISVQYNLDGASHLETYSGSGMPLPFPEALQEFKLVTSAQGASSGGHSAAAVDAVTKSGTNAFHGDVFYFIRNAALNGRDFFAPTGDALKRNQFGGAVGGPIKKDKLFFFIGVQETMIRQTPTPTPSYVPTAAMLQGNFSAYVANNCLGGPFNPGVLSPQNQLLIPISPVALKIASFLPKTNNPCGLVYSSNDPLSENDLQIPVRLDYQRSNKQSLFARYLITRNEQKVPYTIDPSNMLANGNVGADDTAQSLALGDTYLISSTTVNSFRVFVNRMGSDHPYAQTFGPQDVGVKDYYSYLPGLMSIVVAGGGGGFASGVPANFLHTTTGYTNFGFNEDLSWIKGSHQISFGGSGMRAILVGNSYAWSEGFMLFAGVPGIPSFVSTGDGLADFLTGQIINLHQANPNPNWTRQYFFGAYVSDTWKATSRLTINYGLRWNPFTPLVFTQGDTTNFSLANFYSGVRSTVIPNAPPGFSYPGDPGFNGKSGMSNGYDHFEPRIGLAWDPFGDGKTALRVGAGTSYDFINQGVQMNGSSVDPFRTTTVLSGVSLNDPYANVAGGNPFPYSYNPKNPVFDYSSPYQGFYLMPKNLKTTQQYQWNFALQRQFTRAFFVSATYLGSQLIHLWTNIDLNPGQYIPGNCAAGQYGLRGPGPCTQSGNVNQRRLLELTNPAGAGNVLGDMMQMDSGGTQRYNGLLLTAAWRKNNVNVFGNYTWSHCIGLPYTSVTNVGAAYIHEEYQNNGPANRRLDYGDCTVGNLDIRQVANITAVLNGPKLSGGAWYRRLLSNWSASTIYTVRTGWPITPVLSSDVAENGLFASSGGYQVPQRPNQVLANASISNQGQSCPTAPCVEWFNPNAYASPATGTYGNAGVGSLRAPGFWEWDQALIRDFYVTETQHIQFRAEAFNVTNSVRFNISEPFAPGSDNSTTLGEPQFGTIYNSASTTGSATLTGSGGRIMQFALKYVF